MKQHTTHIPHLVAIPPAIAVVSHTYGGLGFEPVALSVAVSASLAVGTWSAWSHVFAPRVRPLARSFGLVAAIALSGAEGWLMYQHHGDVVDPGYAAAMENYTLQESRYQGELAAFEANKEALVASIKRQQQEIIDTDKLTSRRADMERLTARLEKAANSQPPAFGLEKPVEKRMTNTAWLYKVAGIIAATPILYGVLHMFGWRGRKNADATTDSQQQSEAPPAPSDKGSEPSLADVLKIEALPVGFEFVCPVCGITHTKVRANTVTCKSGRCRTAVSRLRRTAKTDNIITLRKAS